MTTFDEIINNACSVFADFAPMLNQLDWLILNRDLLGSVRLIAPASARDEQSLSSLVEGLANQLHPHVAPVTSAILFEDRHEDATKGAVLQPIPGYPNIFLADRLATENDWTSISEISPGAPRIVFFSIKGGVGRSTALAACAWSLAQLGKRVLVLDLDLESPGLSTALLPDERQPAYGITDWLVEDLVDQGDRILDDMIASSDLSRDGEIFVVPAHGSDPGEYVAKLGRVWMPKTFTNGKREGWTGRLFRLISQLEARLQPDVILIDSRAGIDDVAASCVTSLGAGLVLLFALEGSQTWSGYRILFEHWRRHDVVKSMRERLQIVAALVPETDRLSYLHGLRENFHSLFSESLYDEIPAGELIDERFHFEEPDEGAPHYPWSIHWHRGFAALRSLHGRLAEIDSDEVRAIFGGLIDNLTETAALDD